MHAESGEEIHAKYTKGRTREGRGVNKSLRARGITQREWRRITQRAQREMHAEGAELNAGSTEKNNAKCAEENERRERRVKNTESKE